MQDTIEEKVFRFLNRDPRFEVRAISDRENPLTVWINFETQAFVTLELR